MPTRASRLGTKHEGRKGESFKHFEEDPPFQIHLVTLLSMFHSFSSSAEENLFNIFFISSHIKDPPKFDVRSMKTSVKWKIG